MWRLLNPDHLPALGLLYLDTSLWLHDSLYINTLKLGSATEPDE